MPERIQMRRDRPWRAEHPDAVKVDRTTKWGNPFRVEGKTVTYGPTLDLWTFATEDAAVAHAVNAFRWQLEHHAETVLGFTVDDVRHELAGKDLACWCDPDSPCHADVLLEVANS